MAVDLSIYNALLQPGPSAREVSNALADRRMRDQDMATQRQMNALQMQKAQMEMGGIQRAEQEAGALRNFAGSPGFDLGSQDTRAKLWQIAPGKAGAMIKDYTAQQETEAKIAKEKADAERVQLETKLKRIGAVKNAVSAAKDQATYQQALQYLQANGVDVSGVPMQFDPAYVANMGQMAMTAEERLKADFERQRIAESQRHNRTTEGLTARGLEMADRRARDGLAQSERHFQTTQTNAKNTGGTVEERNAAGYSSRMEQATKLLDKHEEKGKPSISSALAGTVPFVGDTARRFNSTPDQQMYRQAQEDWVRAKLRKESGAAIGKDEMEREIETYFPQIGDAEEVIAQKKQARLVANEAMRNASGRAVYESAVKPPPAPEVDALVEKYRTPKNGNNR